MRHIQFYACPCGKSIRDSHSQIPPAPPDNHPLPPPDPPPRSFRTPSSPGRTPDLNRQPRRPLLSTQERPPRFTPSSKKSRPGPPPDPIPLCGLTPPSRRPVLNPLRLGAPPLTSRPTRVPASPPEPRCSPGNPLPCDSTTPSIVTRQPTPLGMVRQPAPWSTKTGPYAPSPGATRREVTSASATSIPFAPLQKPPRKDRLPGFTQAVTRPSTLKTPPPTRYTPRGSSSLTAPLRRIGRDSPEFAI